MAERLVEGSKAVGYYPKKMSQGIFLTSSNSIYTKTHMTITQLAFASLQKSQLRSIIEDMIRQGPTHEKNIEMIFDILYVACEKEFSEEGPASLKAYLQERFINVLNKH